MRALRTLTLLPLLLAAWLLFPVAAGAQSGLPGDDRHGKEGTWDLGPKTPPPRGEEDDESGRKKAMRKIRCRLLEVQDLGRIYVQELSGVPPYWIQLPDGVKILAVRKADFDGRRKLKLEDLEAGQRLEVILRQKDDEILKVKVRTS